MHRINAVTLAIIISIHAPARGASVGEKAILKDTKFQFTPLREGLLGTGMIDSLIILHFNSRPCERGFELQKERLLGNNISIHAPARGASQRIRILQFHI